MPLQWNKDVLRLTLTLSDRMSSSSSPNATDHDRDHTRRHTRRGPSARYSIERERTLSSSSVQDLIRLLIAEEHETKSSRRLLQTALRRLDEETQRADAADTRAQTATERFRVLAGELLASQGEVARTREEVGMYRVQLEAAQREIERAGAVLVVLEKERDEAEQEAARARSVARRMGEETMVERAREEGRRMGFEEGLRRGREVRWEERVGVGEGSVRTRLGNGSPESFALGLDSAGGFEGGSRTRPRSESISSMVTGLSALDLVSLPNPVSAKRERGGPALSVIREDVSIPGTSRENLLPSANGFEPPTGGLEVSFYSSPYIERRFDEHPDANAPSTLRWIILAVQGEEQDGVVE